MTTRDLEREQGVRPFLVYATDSPSYPGVHGDYSKSRRAATVHGSLAVVSGGFIRHRRQNRHASEVFLDGSIDLPNRLGGRFFERALQQLVSHDSRVTLLYTISRAEARAFLSVARRAGLEASEANDVAEGHASSYAVCTGAGWMLSSFNWLEQVVGMEPFFVLSSAGSPGRLEEATVRAALDRTNVIQAAARVLDTADQRPDSVLDALGEYELFAWPTDPHQRSLQLHRRDPELGVVESVFHRTASRLEVRLYSAGSLRRLDKSGHRFAEFASWESWCPLPSHWREMA